MAQVIFTFPDNQLNRIVDALAVVLAGPAGPYDPVRDGPKAAYVRARLQAWIRRAVLIYEAQRAGREADSAAQATVLATGEPDITVT